MVKSEKGGDENLKRFFFVWLKLKIETKMRKGKYVHVYVQERQGY
jgi:hypothetical protein